MLVRKDIVMKSKKVVIISSLILFIFGFLLIVLGYCFNKMCLNPLMVELIKNLGFGIFCSSAVTFGISGPEYHIVKKKSLEKYLVESNKLLHSFLKIEYSSGSWFSANWVSGKTVLPSSPSHVSSKSL